MEGEFGDADTQHSIFAIEGRLIQPIAGKHDPGKWKNHVANFKTGTIVKRLRRAGQLRPAQVDHTLSLASFRYLMTQL